MFNDMTYEEVYDKYIRPQKIQAFDDGYKQGRADAIAEISREIRFLYGNEYEKQIRADAIDEYSNELWRIIELATINCKLDLTIDDLHNLEMLIKGLAEDLKEQNNG